MSELREPAVGTGELDRLAERLEDRDRLDRLRPPESALARVPVEPGHDPRAAAHGQLVVQIPIDGDRAFDRRERVLEPADEVRGDRQLLEHGRVIGLWQPLDEIGDARR